MNESGTLQKTYPPQCVKTVTADEIKNLDPQVSQL